MLLPAVNKVYERATQLELRLTALRVVEAIRLYAAAHDGKLPTALADVTEVPVPDDPATGKPFAYAARGDSATLTAPPLDRLKPGHALNIFTYELTTAK